MSDTDAAAVTEQAHENVDAWISGDPAKMEWASRPDNGAPERQPGENVYVPDPSKGDDPVYAKTETAALNERAATRLSELGPEGQALVQEWGGHNSPDFHANLSYMREAFRDISANRPDLIAKVDASGLGNDPAVLKMLAEYGRMQAHTIGDYTVERNRNSRFDEPRRPLPRGQSAAQSELNKIFKDTPPGSDGYKAKAVQDRVRQLGVIIAGDDSIVGMGGRTA